MTTPPTRFCKCKTPPAKDKDWCSRCWRFVSLAAWELADSLDTRSVK